MSKLIKSIGNCRMNGIGFSIYENDNGTASIRPDKMGHDLPKKHWITFDSASDAQEFVDQFDNENLSAAGLVQALKDGPFSDMFKS